MLGSIKSAYSGLWYGQDVEQDLTKTRSSDSGHNICTRPVWHYRFNIRLSAVVCAKPHTWITWLENATHYATSMFSTNRKRQGISDY